MENLELDILRVNGVRDLWILEEYTWEYDEIILIIPDASISRFTTDEFERIINCINTFETEAQLNGFAKIEQFDDEMYHDHVRKYIREE